MKATRSGRRSRSGGVLFLRATALFAIGLLGTLPSTAQQRQASGPPSFAERVDLGLVRVTVTDDDGDPVTDLEAADFTVREGGQPREIAYFDNESARRLELAVVIDASGSIERHVPDIRPLLRDFLAALRADDCVLLLPFSDAIGPGYWGVDVRAFVDTLATGGNTRLRDAVRAALLVLSGNDEGPSVRAGSAHCRNQVDERLRPRKAVVLITDGADTASTVSFGELAATAWELRIPVITLGVGPAAGAAPSYSGNLFTFTRALARDLTELADASGGRYLPARDDRRHELYFRRILATLRSSYVLGYRVDEAPPTGSLSWRPLRVDTRRPGAEVAAPDGVYVSAYDPEASAAALRRGIVELEAGDYRESLETFTRATELYWESAEAHHQRSVAAQQAGLADAAREAALWALFLAPDRPEVVSRARATGAIPPLPPSSAAPNEDPIDVWIEPASHDTIARQRLARALTRAARFQVRRDPAFNLVRAPRVLEPSGGLVLRIRDVDDNGDVHVELALQAQRVRPAARWFRVASGELIVAPATAPTPPAALTTELNSLLAALR